MKSSKIIAFLKAHLFPAYLLHSAAIGEIYNAQIALPISLNKLGI